MTTKAAVDDFLAQRTLAVVGVSRDGKKFGNTIYKELKLKGYTVFAVNPKSESIMGDRCYPDLSAIPVTVGGAVIVVPPVQTEQVVRDAASAGIRHIWMQRGAESEAAIHFCKENGINAVCGECILMFAEPAAFYHRIHRWFWRMLGKLPK